MKQAVDKSRTDRLADAAAILLVPYRRILPYSQPNSAKRPESKRETPSRREIPPGQGTGDRTMEFTANAMYFRRRPPGLEKPAAPRYL